jgi:hypothetical protein
MTSRKSPAPAAPRHTGPWNEFADATGIEAKYLAEQDEADRQLKDATAGPDRVEGEDVATGDTAMKNPHGAFAAPSPDAGRHVRRPDPGVDGQSNRRPGGAADPEGQQGGYVRCGGQEQQVPVGGVRTPQGKDP